MTVFHSFLSGVKMITCMLAGIGYRRRGLTYYNVMDTRCFYKKNIIYATDLHYILLLQLIKVIVAFLYSLSIVDRYNIFQIGY